MITVTHDPPAGDFVIKLISDKLTADSIDELNSILNTNHAEFGRAKHEMLNTNFRAHGFPQVIVGCDSRPTSKKLVGEAYNEAMECRILAEKIGLIESGLDRFNFTIFRENFGAIDVFTHFWI